jgi:uncharacterized protein
MKGLGKRACLRIATFSLALLTSLVFGVSPAWANRSIPLLAAPVIDETGKLTSNEKLTLSNELRSYLPKLQLQIWMVNSLEGEPIENLSIRAATEWGLGSAKDDQGALILVALQDRKMRIEVGQGLEGLVTDLLAGRIIRGLLAPSFRSGHFYDGLLSASRAIQKLSQGIELKDTDFGKRKRKIPTWVLIVFMLAFNIFVIIPLHAARQGMRNGFRGSRYRNNQSASGGFWSGGGGGSGGGWSGGGGGFSGGGSSGGW